MILGGVIYNTYLCAKYDIKIKGVEESDIDLARDLVKLDQEAGKIIELPFALQRRVVESLLWQLRCKASYTHIMKIVEAAQTGKTGTEIHLSRGLRVGVQRKFLEFLYPEGKSSWRGRLYKKK